MFCSIGGATTTFITGTPNFNGNGALSPVSGTLINFDDSATIQNVANSGGSYALPSNAYASLGLVSISDPSGLFVQPYSTQSEPDFVTNGNAITNGEADITLALSHSVSFIGVGIGDADGVPITLNLLGASGTIASETINLPTDTQNPYNGYYAFLDTTADITGLSIIQATDLTGSSPSGLAIDDVQFAPEPGSFLLIGAGGLALAAFRFRKRSSH